MEIISRPVIFLMLALLWGGAPTLHAAENANEVQIGDKFTIDKTEVTIDEFSRFVAATGTVTKAERDGGGLVYASGWEHKSGWTWRTPFGRPAAGDEPSVHVTFDEAQAYCRWNGKRLPTQSEWIEAAYTERRENPPPPFENRQQPTPIQLAMIPKGQTASMIAAQTPAIDYSMFLDRGLGHAKVGTTRAGVNGLFDMGANVWEWVETGNERSKGTRGGSWWYGATQMRSDYNASKSRGMAVVYIGFRCVRDIR